MVSLLILIGLMGLGMADIDIPPVEEKSFGGRPGILPIMFEQEVSENQTCCEDIAEIAKVPSVGQNQVCNCTIIMIMCNCTLPGSFFFFKCEFRRGLASVFVYLPARMPRGFASVKFIDSWKQYIVI